MLIVNVLLRLKCVHKSGAKLIILFELDNRILQMPIRDKWFIISKQDSKNDYEQRGSSAPTELTTIYGLIKAT